MNRNIIQSNKSSKIDHFNLQYINKLQSQTKKRYQQIQINFIIKKINTLQILTIWLQAIFIIIQIAIVSTKQSLKEIVVEVNWILVKFQKNVLWYIVECLQFLILSNKIWVWNLPGILYAIPQDNFIFNNNLK